MQLNGPPAHTHVLPPGDDVATYWVMTDPPSDAGGDQLTTARPLPAVATTEIGGPGGSGAAGDCVATNTAAPGIDDAGTAMEELGGIARALKTGPKMERWERFGGRTQHLQDLIGGQVRVGRQHQRDHAADLGRRHARSLVVAVDPSGLGEVGIAPLTASVKMPALADVAESPIERPTSAIAIVRVKVIVPVPFAAAQLQLMDQTNARA